MTAKSTFLD